MSTSINAVINYLNKIDPTMAETARQRYGCLTPWEQEPAAYGRAVLSDSYRDCEEEAVTMLRDMLQRRIEYSAGDGERYYRLMYYGSVDSWNLRDKHMFDTLERLFDFHGSNSKGIVWAHNSHVGNAAFTEMGARGEFNIGQLCRVRFADSAFLLGFGTDRGTVAAASDWDGPMEFKRIVPSHEASYERLCHDSGMEAFMLPLRNP